MCAFSAKFLFYSVGEMKSVSPAQSCSVDVTLPISCDLTFVSIAVWPRSWPMIFIWKIHTKTPKTNRITDLPKMQFFQHGQAFLKFRSGHDLCWGKWARKPSVTSCFSKTNLHNVCVTCLVMQVFVACQCGKVVGRWFHFSYFNQV